MENIERRYKSLNILEKIFGTLSATCVLGSFPASLYVFTNSGNEQGFYTGLTLMGMQGIGVIFAGLERLSQIGKDKTICKSGNMEYPEPPRDIGRYGDVINRDNLRWWKNYRLYERILRNV